MSTSLSTTLVPLSKKIHVLIVYEFHRFFYLLAISTPSNIGPSINYQDVGDCKFIILFIFISIIIDLQFGNL